MSAHVKASSKAVAPFNAIIASSSDLSHPITTIHSNTQNVGYTVCFFGVTTHPASPCGVIEVINVDAWFTREDGFDLHVFHMVQMSKAGGQGDSGGPVYSGLAAYGIVTAVNPLASSHVIYSMIGYVDADLGTTVCTSSSC
jgi:hypothetical protein